MSDPYEGMSYIKTKIKRVYHFIVNSELWFHLYYKHTKDWKKQLVDVERRALEFRARCEAEE